MIAKIIFILIAFFCVASPILFMMIEAVIINFNLRRPNMKIERHNIKLIETELEKGIKNNNAALKEANKAMSNKNNFRGNN